MAAVATGDLVRSLSREESLSSRGVSLVARSLSRREGVACCEESLIARSLSRREVSLASRCEESLIERGEEEDG